MVWNDRIAYLRKKSDITLKDVAKRLGVSEATAQRYESSIKNIPYEIIMKYALIFGVEPSYIMGWTDDEIVSDVAGRISIEVTEEEAALVGLYRKASEQQKRIAEYALRLRKES